MYIHLDADLVMRTPCTMKGFAVLRCYAVLRQLRAAPDPSLSADRHVPDIGGQPVLTRLDYSISILADFPVYLVRRLQSVLNAAARLTYHLRRSDHISDALACYTNTSIAIAAFCRHQSLD